jgi:hypothetical protein
MKKPAAPGERFDLKVEFPVKMTGGGLPTFRLSLV